MVGKTTSPTTARKRKAPAKLPAAFRHLLLSPLRDNWLSLDGAFKVTSSRLARDPGQARGRLRIGDDWNAITIIALSQSNPLKAIAELVENSIDAKRVR